LKITFENAGSASLGAGVATFGQVFLPGQLPSGAGLVTQFGQTSGFVQIEVKSRYADGSVKMAVLAVERPALVAGATVDIIPIRADVDSCEDSQLLEFLIP